MKFYSQNDLLAYWEGGKSYRQADTGEEVISDASRTLPFLTKKYFEVKAKYDAGMKQMALHEHFGSMKNGGVVMDAQYKMSFKGGRAIPMQGVFLFSFIEDCISLWEAPL